MIIKMKFDQYLINEVLTYTRLEITNEIIRYINLKRSGNQAYPGLYDLVLDYPVRKGKMLRPAI